MWLKDWRESGFEFVGHWHQHWRRRALFRRDRLNLNSVGSRVLANRITRAVQSIKLNIERGEQIGNEWMKLNGRRMQERLGRKTDVIGQNQDQYKRGSEYRTKGVIFECTWQLKICR